MKKEDMQSLIEEVSKNFDNVDAKTKLARAMLEPLLNRSRFPSVQDFFITTPLFQYFEDIKVDGMTFYIEYGLSFPSGFQVVPQETESCPKTIQKARRQARKNDTLELALYSEIKKRQVNIACITDLENWIQDNLQSTEVSKMVKRNLQKLTSDQIESAYRRLVCDSVSSL